VRDWLEHHSGWLLIFDNAAEPGELRGYLPRGPSKQVLITSRHRDWNSLAQSVTVQTWPRKEAVEFLLKRSRQTGRKTAENLAGTLGDLPLALEQAAAYMRAAALPFEKYLALFNARRAELWQEERPPETYHRDTVATTWSLALEEVNAAAAVGVEILNLCAYLAPDNIPRTLLERAAEYLPEDLAEMFQNPLTVNKGIQELNHYSLIDSGPDTLSIHRLVQAVVQDRLDGEAQKIRVSAAAQLINDSFPGDGYNNPQSWPRCKELLSHALTIADHTEKHQTALEASAALLNNVAGYSLGRAAYSDAESLLRRALDIREKQLGKDHPDVAQSLNNLASLLRAQGNYSDAEPLYRRALEIREKALGKDHPSVAVSLWWMGVLHEQKGNFVEAEKLYRRALQIYLKVFGEKHPNTQNLKKYLQDLSGKMKSPEDK
jgi:tetratricopeptide (TPR) repeat protein